MICIAYLCCHVCCLHCKTDAAVSSFPPSLHDEKYSPRVEAGKHTLPGHMTPLKGLLLTGDYTFPGIGVPATAASGAITANNLLSVPQHWAMLDKIRLPKKL
jgi:hypothetical protein